MIELSVIGCWWLVVGGCWLLVVGGWWLLVVGGCWLLVVGGWWLVVSSYELVIYSSHSSHSPHSPHLPITPSPHHPTSPSPHHPITPPPHLYRGLTLGLLVFSLARLSAACLNNGSILFRQYSILGNFSGCSL